jgi:transaldolase
MADKNLKLSKREEYKQAKIQEKVTKRMQEDEKSKEVFAQLKKISNFVPGSTESLLSMALKTGSRVANPKNYQDYLKVKELLDSGVSVFSMPKIVKIPYTTCYAYSKMTTEDIKKLKDRENNSGSKTNK